MAAGIMYPLSLSDLKAFTPGANPNDLYYLTDARKEGEFLLEATYNVPAQTPPAADDAITVNSNTLAGKVYRYRRVIEEGYISARWFGAVGDGTTDDSTAIQNAVDTLEGVTIIFDAPGGADYFIDTATITVPQGITLRFRPGNKITGTGGITGGIIDAGYDQQIFDPTLTIVHEAQTTEMFSVKWFGAKGDNSTDDHPAIQKTIDTLATMPGFQNPQKIYLPAASYKINAPLIISNFYAGEYQQVTLQMHGDSDFWPSSGLGTRIVCNINQTFGIGIQGGKGVIIKGLQLSGIFTPPTLTPTEFYMIEFGDYVDPTCRDTAGHYSPYAGIVIDPFGPSVPSDGGYPGYTSYYQGTATGGSTGTTIDNCFINNFVVGICNSPTEAIGSNDELTLIQNVQFQACKLCISISHDQEKTNKINRCACWGPAHTFFASHKYGIGRPGNWELDNVQLAGMVNTFVEHDGAGYFPSFIKNCYAESVGKFGTWKSGVGSKVQDCLFDFADLSTAAHSYQELYITSNKTVVFENCVIRLYGSNVPITLKGPAIYKNCVFEVIPCCFGDTDGMPAFIDCTANAKMFGPSTTQVMPFPLNTISSYGKFEIYRPDQMTTQVREKFLFDNLEVQIVGFPTTTVTPAFAGTNRSFTFTALASELHIYDVGRVILADGLPMGIITAINTGTYAVTVSYTSPHINSATTYSISVVHPLVIGYPFMGNVAQNSNVIDEVRGDMGNLNLNVGIWVRSLCFVTDVYSPYVKILTHSVDPITSVNSYTVSSTSFYTQEAIHFYNGSAKEVILGSANASMYPYIILPTGSQVHGKANGLPAIWSVRKTGFMNAASQSDPRQALMAMEYPYRGLVKKAIIADYTLQMEDDILEVDCTSGDVDIQLVQPVDVLATPLFSGKTITVRKSDSSINVVNILKNTVGTNDPIDGQNSITLSAQYDSVTINIGFTDVVSVGVLK